MPILDRSKPQESDAAVYELLETDVYEMTIDTCMYQQSRFKNDKTGEFPMEYVIVWVEPETDSKVWQHFNPFYGTTKTGAPSRWKEFIDSLADQDMLPDGEFEPETTLPGIKQRVSVQKYIKTQGENAGKEGNKVTAVLPLKPRRSPKPAPKVPEGQDKLDW